MVNMLYYDLLSEFKRQFYKDILTVEHLQGSQINLTKLVYPDKTTDEEANFWGYVFEKNGKKYSLSSFDKDNNEYNLRDVLPIIPQKLQKVAAKGVVYYMIHKPISVKFKEEKTMSFRDMIDVFTALKHTNVDHQKLLWFMTLAQMYDRANFRFCTPAGFGKDSTVDIIGNLIGSAATIENPTIAKLEFMTNNKLLAINEVVDVQKGDWRNIQQFLLATGAHKPEVTKHSRATASGVGEVLNISKFSISLMYNDIDHYGDPKQFFDTVTKTAVNDRFPALRLYGTFEEDFNSIKTTDVRKYVQDNYEEYKKLIYAYTYYKENYMKYFHNYSVDKAKIATLPERWKINIGRLLKIIDVYCNSQEEFDYWLNVVNTSLDDYNQMLVYPKNLERLQKVCTGEQFYDKVVTLKKADTYIERNKLINQMIDGDEPVNDSATIWSFEQEV